MELEAKVLRVSNAGVCIVEDPSREHHGFTFDKIDNYGGQYPKEMGLIEGTDVTVTLSPEGLVESVAFPFIDRRPKLFGRWVLPWAVNS